MNLPNKLTVSRAILAPLFLATMLITAIPYNYTISLLLFIAASLTDLFDGKIARKRGLVTTFGKFLDPIADKMLTTAALLGFMIILPTVCLKVQFAVITFITMFREFAVASVRLIAVSSEKKKVIPANIWGKLKTVSQMASIIFGLFAYSVMEFVSLSCTAEKIALVIFAALSWIAAVLGVISGFIYVFGSRELIDPSK
ncbi:MAG: CDP-diacylglycerol--glycerol-3-phosphate 3-phosphatidyltransferase [Clostridia bacterium]|nr:CDP-diacylglycerol--glycerol-3-phosphate 3-phosphatidyltransferase [Clostridia bacterium]